MKISARNMLPGKVVALTKGIATAQLKIEVAPGILVTSLITNESCEELGLAIGDTVTAIVKASDVMVGK